MKNKFICPECQGIINPKNELILSLKTKHDQVGLIFLEPELGNYSKYIESDIDVEEGEKVDIFCPICHTNLVEPMVDANLVRIMMVDENDEKHHILFSGIFGEQCTYKVTKGKVEKFGDDSSRYLNFENLIDLL